MMEAFPIATEIHMAPNVSTRTGTSENDSHQVVSRDCPGRIAHHAYLTLHLRQQREYQSRGGIWYRRCVISLP